GPRAVEQLGRTLEQIATGTDSQVTLTYRRDGVERDVTVPLDPVCSYAVHVTNEGILNASADGKAVYVEQTMMRFAEDHELAAVVAHEIAHNAMGHIDAKM